jgi:competence protein ComEC
MLRALVATIVLVFIALSVTRAPSLGGDDARHVVHLLGVAGRSAGPLRIAGTIAQPVRYAAGSATIVLHATSLGPAQAVPLSGLLRLRVQHCSRRFALGERIAIRSTLRVIENFGNPGEFDWAAWNRRRGIGVSAYVWSDRDVVTLQQDGRPGAITGLRRRMSEHAATAANRGAALLAAVTVGDRGGLDGATLSALRDAGMAHALAISGLHIGLLAGACLVGVRRALLETSFVRAGNDAVPPACAAAVLAILAYSLLGGGGVSVIRAVVMGSAALGVLALAGNGRPLEVVGWAAAALSVVSPGVALEAGFQLSFAATLGLVSLAARRPLGRLSLIAVPLLAWAVTTPIVAQHFQRISLIAPAVNLLAAPLVSATVLLGLAGTALLGLSGTVAEPVLALAAVAAGWLLALCDRAAGFDWAAADVVSPGPLLTFLLSAAPLVALQGSRRGLAALSTAIVVLVGVAAHERYRSDQLDLYFVSVGQGDATIVKLPGGKVAVVDGGRPGRGRLLVAPWLARMHVRRIDYLVATHVQADHWGGLVELAERFEIGEFWHNGGICEVDAFARWLLALESRGVAVVDVAGVLARGEAAPRGSGSRGAGIAVLAPRETDGACDANDRSLVVSVRYAGHGVLLAGDLEKEGERRLVMTGAGLRHDVLKAPHHGSRTSSSNRLLDAVEPWLAVAGCGAGNRYGFPHAAVVARYRERGSVFLSTARHGAVSLRIDARGVRVRTAKKL